jgi:23S rRNA (guanine745-N1)-methyltransferase
LDAGYYEVLSNKINEILDSINAHTVLDAGCGEGYYTNRMAQNRAVLGIDLSRAGVEYAARRAKQTDTGAAFAVASIFSLPVQDGSLDAITNIFSPCSEAEFCRALKDGGYLCLVGAGERHLMGLKEVLYENPYENPGRADLPQSMTEVARHRIHTTVTINGQDAIQALFSTTPYYWRTSPKDREKLAQVESLTTEIDFDLFLYRKDPTV